MPFYWGISVDLHLLGWAIAAWESATCLVTPLKVVFEINNGFPKCLLAWTQRYCYMCSSNSPSLPSFFVSPDLPHQHCGFLPHAHRDLQSHRSDLQSHLPNGRFASLSPSGPCVSWILESSIPVLCLSALCRCSREICWIEFFWVGITSKLKKKKILA